MAFEVQIAAHAGDPSVSDVPDPASGSHCWRRSEAHDTWHGPRKNLTIILRWSGLFCYLSKDCISFMN